MVVSVYRMGKGTHSQGGGKSRYVAPGVSSVGKKGSGYLGDRKLIPRIKEVGPKVCPRTSPTTPPSLSSLLQYIKESHGHVLAADEVAAALQAQYR